MTKSETMAKSRNGWDVNGVALSQEIWPPSIVLVGPVKKRGEVNEGKRDEEQLKMAEATGPAWRAATANRSFPQLPPASWWMGQQTSKRALIQPLAALEMVLSKHCHTHYLP